jgi:dTDP-4-amino-4,6-dideoxygalactose transaminase
MTVIDDFEEEFKKFTNVKHAIACSNGTAALHTAVSAIGIGKGDKVITTPFTFIASSNCLIYNNAVPIFADINRNDYLIDPTQIEELLIHIPDIKAILPVHLFGKSCDMKYIMMLSDQYNIPVIEDCAQALGAIHDGVHVGNFGEVGIFSFYASKNLSTFEGGMVVTNNDEIAEFCRMFINHGSKKRYVHEIIGYNYRMPQICALIGLTQLKLHKKGIIAELGAYGIDDGYYPEVIYNQPLYKKLGITGNCPIAEEIANIVKTKI